MGFIESLARTLKKDEDFQNAQKARKIQRIITEREKSSNERVLEKFQEEERQKIIKRKLDEINKRNNDMQFNKKLVPEKNIFQGGSDILKGGTSMLKSGNNILSSDNIHGGGNMFFK